MNRFVQGCIDAIIFVMFFIGLVVLTSCAKEKTHLDIEYTHEHENFIDDDL